MISPMIFARLILLILCLAAAPSAIAQTIGEIPRDSNYYMMDDGEQSPEEMVMEAQYVHKLCDSNGYQATYFDCACLAGAFLLERERVGPMVLQQEILFDLTKSRNAKCANTAVMAGRVYEGCMNYANSMRELASDNEQLCSCAANKAASDFTRAPRLSVDYIRGIRRQAMRHCFNPANRTYGGQAGTNSTSTELR